MKRLYVVRVIPPARQAVSPAKVVTLLLADRRDSSVSTRRGRPSRLHDGPSGPSLADVAKPAYAPASEAGGLRP